MIKVRKYWLFDGKDVKISIVYIKAKTTSWFLIQENQCFNKKFERPNKVISKIDFNLSF